MNNLLFIVIALALIIYIIMSVRQSRLSVKTSFGWMLASLLMLFLAIFPKSLDWLATILGVEYPPTLILILCVVLLFTINFNYGKKISELQNKIISLAQEVSILRASQNQKSKTTNKGTSGKKP